MLRAGTNKTMFCSVFSIITMGSPLLNGKSFIPVKRLVRVLSKISGTVKPATVPLIGIRWFSGLLIVVTWQSSAMSA